MLQDVVGLKALSAGAALVAVLSAGCAPGAAALGLRGGFDQAVRGRGFGGVGRVLAQTGFQLSDALVRLLQFRAQMGDRGGLLNDQRGKLLVGRRALVGGSHWLIVAETCAAVEPVNWPERPEQLRPASVFKAVEATSFCVP